MSEMSAEKKKEIEKYIIKSYFGGGKNVESLANGADVIKGTDDGYIPQLIAEVTCFGGSGVVMINWDVYDEPHGTEWKNSFAMRICREREIERNRCDSVDSMVYAWEAWKSRILNKPLFLETNDEDLQKDKRIEELEREVKALRAEKEVMERHIQELESHNTKLQARAYGNADLAKQWEENYNLLLKRTGFDAVGTLNFYLTNVGCDTLLEALTNYGNKAKALQAENDKWQEATGRIGPEEAKQYIERLKDRLNKIHDYSVDW